MFEDAVLLLGGNKGNREALLEKALELLTESQELLLKSHIYETEAWGGVARGPFLNQIVQIGTSLSPIELLDLVQNIESKLGRQRAEPWGDRTMDIDIIFYGNQQISNERLKIPHPFISERRFVLVPMVEILPEFIHPVLQKSISALLQACEDRSEVLVYTPGDGR